ncbi:hypothetical protein H6G65_10720 [Microcystis elabens FACHB-917]|nr:hypothetical protein [Microcystis elabens FACHB-917]
MRQNTRYQYQAIAPFRLADQRRGAAALGVVPLIAQGNAIGGEGLALAVHRQQPLTTIHLPQLAVAAAQRHEGVKEGAPLMAADAVLGLAEQALQQRFLAQVLHLRAGLIPLFFNAAHPAQDGLVELALAVGHLALELLALALGVLQAGVLVGVDLREARQLGAGLAQLLFQLCCDAVRPAGDQQCWWWQRGDRRCRRCRWHQGPGIGRDRECRRR